jgi:hypothetical protein
MADTHYAWSPILAGDKSAKFGDEVTASGLGVDKEEFQAMIDGGSVRTTKPPPVKDMRTDESVIDFYRRQAREAALAAGEEVAEAQLAAHNAVAEVG